LINVLSYQLTRIPFVRMNCTTLLDTTQSHY